LFVTYYLLFIFITYICRKFIQMAKDKTKTIKSVKLTNDLIKRIEAKASKVKRSPHYLMVECLEKGFK